MSQDPVHILTIAKVIQTAVAPVFLITGIAATLGVLSNRLSRITDMARLLDRKLNNSQNDSFAPSLTQEMRALLKRSRCIHIAFSMSILSALLDCAVVMMMFISHLYTMPLSVTISSCFIGAMILLISAFLALLAEVFLATRSMRRGMIFKDIQ